MYVKSSESQLIFNFVLTTKTPYWFSLFESYHLEELVLVHFNECSSANDLETSTRDDKIEGCLVVLSTTSTSEG